MKRSIFFWSLMLSLFGIPGILSAQSSLPEAEEHQITSGNFERTFLVHAPAGTQLGVAEALPVLFMFHGSSGDGEKFFRISGWVPKADAEGFIAVFPDGLRYCIEDEGRRRQTTKWHDYKLPTYVCEDQELPDDVQFVRDMIAYLDSNFAIDHSRIYASGFSNGAGFVSRLAVEMSETLAAVAIVGGGLYPNDSLMQRPIPVYQIAGGADSRVLEDRADGSTIPRDPDSLRNDFQIATQIDQWVRLLHLPGTFRSKQVRKHTTLYFTDQANEGSSEYVFSLVRGLEHRYPNEHNNPAGLVAADLFWTFFSRHQLPE